MSDPRYQGYPPGLYTDDRQRPQPWPLPQPYDPSGQFFNPAGTVPGPGAKNAPRAYWVCTPTHLVWASGTAPVVNQATWRTPVFDFRPDLQRSDGPRSSAVPIYRPGGGGRLYVQIFGVTEIQSALTLLEVTSREFGNVWRSTSQVAGSGNPTTVPQITEPEDVTDQLFATVPSSILVFSPPGAGYNLRYWSLELTFAKFNADPLPPFRVAAAVY